MLGDVVDTVGGAVGDVVGDGLSSILQEILYATVYKLLYYLDVALCWIVELLYKMFSVFAGVSEISYHDGALERKDYLLNYFFHHESIKNVYWDMAMIGIALCFFFTIIAVIKKAGDLDGKQQHSYGQILRGTAKSVIVILLMTAIMTAAITATNVLMSAITTAFNRSDNADQRDSIVFTEDQYATMARVLNTIGNYSLSSSSTSRYNINSCYNEIRPDLEWLQGQGVFDFYYEDVDENGNPIESWQSALQKIVNAADLRYDMNMDVYNASVSHAITDVMETINSNASFRPWASYERKEVFDTTQTPMDVIVFLMGTSEAANNEEFNKAPSLTDNLRGPYYSGSKSIYDIDEVSDDFDIAVGKMDHLIIVVGAIKIIVDLAICTLNAVARIFNLLLLYLISPLVISVSPMDNGGKFKQWTTAFIIQCLGILGIVISMRLLILYLPIISNSDLELFDNQVMNMLGKLLLLLGGTEAAKRANGLITGILADNAGMQSIAAGDMSSVATGALGKTAAFAGGVVAGAAGFAADVTGITGAKQRMSEGYKRFTERGGIVGSIANKVSPTAGQTSEERAAERQQEYGARLSESRGDGGGKSGGGGGSSSGGGSGGMVGGGNKNNIAPPQGGGASKGGPQSGGAPKSGGTPGNQSKNLGGGGAYDAKFTSGGSKPGSGSNVGSSKPGGSNLGGNKPSGGPGSSNVGSSPSSSGPSSGSNVGSNNMGSSPSSSGPSSSSNVGSNNMGGGESGGGTGASMNNLGGGGESGSSVSVPQQPTKSVPAHTTSQYSEEKLFGKPKSNGPVGGKNLNSK